MSEPYYRQGRLTLYHGKAEHVLRMLPDNSIDALVTDPPAGVSFMNAAWDNPATFPLRGRRDTDLDTDAVRKYGNDVEYDRSPKARRAFIAFLTEIFSEALRVCKPGAHAFVWALPRTSHWTATALEDAGWEIRDCVYHLFATGFPKSLDISKALDKAVGADRPVVGKSARHGGGIAGNSTSYELPADVPDLTAPATDLAAQWAGWGTALKPAVEVWLLAHKPLTPVPPSDTIEETTLLLEALLWSLAPVKLVDASLASSLSVSDAAPSASVRWIAAVSRMLGSSAASDLTAMFNSPAAASTFWNIVGLWNSILDAVSPSGSTSITATATSLTIGLKTLNSWLSKSMDMSMLRAAFQAGGLWLPANNADGSSTGVATKLTSIPKPSVAESATAHITPAVVSSLASIAEQVLPDSPTKHAVSALAAATTLTAQLTANTTPGATDPSDPRSAVECWWLARKPLGAPNIAANVAQWGTGGLNIAASRVESADNLNGGGYSGGDPTGMFGLKHLQPEQYQPPAGRWPPHLLLSHAEECNGACVPGCPIRELDEQSGDRKAGSNRTGLEPSGKTRNIYGEFDHGNAWESYGDTGGASRFYPTFRPDPPFRFVAKPAQSERNQGCEVLPAKSAGEATGRKDGSAGLQSPRAGAGRTRGARNHHPTVKSLELMRWLCRLVTPPGGVVLDCFGGSGSTIIAADQCGFGAIYIDQDADYCAIAKARLIGDAPLLALLTEGGAA